MNGALDSLNLKKVCATYRVGIWQCPQFLFLMMGFIIIVSILATYYLASLYQDPYVTALTVLALSAVLFLIGYLIVKSFEKVALASLSKSEFISIMSHQLRSPLSAIKWQLNALLSDSVPEAVNISGVMRGYLENIGEQNERMIREVNDLLDVNRIEDNDLILRPTAFSLHNLTKSILGDYNKFVAASNLRAVFDSPDSLSKVYADEERIKRVVEHLLDNAIRYSKKDGEIKVILKDFGDKIMWKVEDSGHGIVENDQKRIFDKFFRSDHVMRYQTEGSGVGLFISKSTIKLSGGEIGFSSASDSGSIFWFTLPTADSLQVNKKL